MADSRKVQTAIAARVQQAAMPVIGFSALGRPTTCQNYFRSSVNQTTGKTSAEQSYSSTPDTTHAKVHGGGRAIMREVLFGMLVIASTMSQAAEPAKLVLACQGHTYYLGADSRSLPVSSGIIVNLAHRTVEGFRYPEDFPIEITDINETTIVFHGSSIHAPGATYRQIHGGIDRTTGDAEATSDVTSWRESTASAIHLLKCRPTQTSPMFPDQDKRPKDGAREQRDALME